MRRDRGSDRGAEDGRTAERPPHMTTGEARPSPGRPSGSYQSHSAPAELRGHVVLVSFWTLTCINWLRQEPHVPAWSQAYRDDRLIVIGVHTRWFSFEHESGHLRQATKEDRVPEWTSGQSREM